MDFKNGNWIMYHGVYRRIKDVSEAKVVTVISLYEKIEINPSDIEPIPLDDEKINCMEVLIATRPSVLSKDGYKVDSSPLANSPKLKDFKLRDKLVLELASERGYQYLHEVQNWLNEELGGCVTIGC